MKEPQTNLIKAAQPAGREWLGCGARTIRRGSGSCAVCAKQRHRRALTDPNDCEILSLDRNQILDFPRRPARSDQGRPRPIWRPKKPPPMTCSWWVGCPGRRTGAT